MKAKRKIEPRAAEPLGKSVEVPRPYRRHPRSKYPWDTMPIAEPVPGGGFKGRPFYVENMTTAKFSSQAAAAAKRYGTRYTVRQLPVPDGAAPRIGVWRLR